MCSLIYVSVSEIGKGEYTMRVRLKQFKDIFPYFRNGCHEKGFGCHQI